MDRDDERDDLWLDELTELEASTYKELLEDLYLAMENRDWYGVELIDEEIRRRERGH